MYEQGGVCVSLTPHFKNARFSKKVVDEPGAVGGIPQLRKKGQERFLKREI